MRDRQAAERGSFSQASWWLQLAQWWRSRQRGQIPDAEKRVPHPTLALLQQFRSAPAGLELIENPRDWVLRAVEEVMLDGPSIRRRVSMEIMVPPLEQHLGEAAARGGMPEMHLPLIRVGKGRLLDNLEVRDVAGNRILTLSHGYHERYAALVLAIAFDEAIAHFGNDFETWRAIRSELLAIPHLSVEDATKQFQRLFVDQDPTPTPAVLAALRDSPRLKELAKFFTEKYVIVIISAAIPGEVLYVEYSYSTQYRDPDPSGRLGSVKRFLGQRPVSLRFGIPLAFHAQSYHFRMTAPVGHYVHKQRFMKADRWRESASTSLYDYIYHPRPPVLTLGESERRGSYVHLYLSGLAGTPLFPLFVRTTFLEEPPGSALMTALIGLVTSITIGIIAALINPLLRARYLSPDLPALLLGVPSILAFWQRHSPHDLDLVRASLMPRVLSLALGLLSLAAALSYLGYTALFRPTRGLDWRDHAYWLSLAAAGLVITGVLCRRIYRGWRTAENAQYAEKKFVA